MQREIKVRAPGSSANLGPGFDSLGVALSRYVQAGNTAEGHPCDEYSIITEAYLAAGGKGSIWFSHNLEPGRGLGFSAAARAVGATVAFAEDGRSLDDARDDIYEVTSKLEGHCDNAAACVYGGFTIVSDCSVRKMKLSAPESLLVWIASEQSSTDKSRLAISESIALCDAVYNIANTATLVSCLYEGDMQALGEAVGDRVHQSARLESSPTSAKAFQAGLDAGASAGWLSGAGPSIVFVVEPDAVEQVIGALPAAGLAISLPVDANGVCEI